MGEYADMCFDRDLDNFLQDRDADDYTIDGCTIKYNELYIDCNNDDFETIRRSYFYGILLRNFKVSLNMNVVFVRETSKAILFQINDEGYKNNGKTFWCPKSILKRKNDTTLEKLIFYVPNWSNLLINE